MHELTVDALLDMELGRKQQRLLRLLLNSPRGVTKEDVLRSLYVERADQAAAVRTGLPHSYWQQLLRELRETLRHFNMDLAVTERHRGRPWRWALVDTREEALATTPLPQVEEGTLPPGVHAAARDLKRMARMIVLLLARAGGRGLSTAELVERLYPARERPTDPGNCISVTLSEARGGLRAHGLAVVARPPAGLNSRRYLVRVKSL